MEARDFRLFPGKDYQVLSMNESLRDMIWMPRFRQIVLDHGGGFSRFNSPEGVIIQPPIPDDRLESFGNAIIDLAQNARLRGDAQIQFVQEPA